MKVVKYVIPVFNSDQGPDASQRDAELPYGFGKAVSINGTTEVFLIDMNDGNELKQVSEHSLSEIADWIEANL